MIYFTILTHAELGFIGRSWVLARTFSKEPEMLSNTGILPLIAYVKGRVAVNYITVRWIDTQKKRFGF